MFFFLEENEIDLARFPQFQTLLFNLTYLCYSHNNIGLNSYVLLNRM